MSSPGGWAAATVLLVNVYAIILNRMNRLNVPLWAAGWIFVTTTALAQSAPPLVPAAAPLSANETPSRATAGADSCQVGPPRIVGQSMGKRLFALRLASDRDTALLTWSTEPNKVQVAALAPNGAVRAQVQSIPLAGARQLVALERFDDHPNAGGSQFPSLRRRDKERSRQLWQSVA